MSLSNVRAVMETTEIAELRAALIVQRRVIALGVRMHRLQVLADSAALGAGLADIEPLDPVWEATQVLSLVPLLRAIPALQERLTVMEKAVEEALQEIESLGGSPD